MSRAPVAGFTLIEALIASGLVVTVSLGTAQLFSYAIAQTSVARDQMLMGVVASAQIDALASAIADGTLAPSPGGSLEGNVEGWNDRVVRSGRVYVRRWAISEAPAYGTSALIIAVRVMPVARGADLTIVTLRRSGVP